MISTRQLHALFAIIDFNYDHQGASCSYMCITAPAAGLHISVSKSPSSQEHVKQFLHKEGHNYLCRWCRIIKYLPFSVGMGLFAGFFML